MAYGHHGAYGVPRQQQYLPSGRQEHQPLGYQNGYQQPYGYDDGYDRHAQNPYSNDNSPPQHQDNYNHHYPYAHPNGGAPYDMGNPYQHNTAPSRPAYDPGYAKPPLRQNGYAPSSPRVAQPPADSYGNHSRPMTPHRAHDRQFELRPAPTHVPQRPEPTAYQNTYHVGPAAVPGFHGISRAETAPASADGYRHPDQGYGPGYDDRPPLNRGISDPVNGPTGYDHGGFGYYHRGPTGEEMPNFGNQRNAPPARSKTPNGHDLHAGSNPHSYASDRRAPPRSPNPNHQGYDQQADYFGLGYAQRDDPYGQSSHYNEGPQSYNDDRRMNANQRDASARGQGPHARGRPHPGPDGYYEGPAQGDSSGHPPRSRSRLPLDQGQHARRPPAPGGGDPRRPRDYHDPSDPRRAPPPGRGPSNDPRDPNRMRRPPPPGMDDPRRRERRPEDRLPKGRPHERGGLLPPGRGPPDQSSGRHHGPSSPHSKGPPGDPRRPPPGGLAPDQIPPRPSTAPGRPLGQDGRPSTDSRRPSAEPPTSPNASSPPADPYGRPPPVRPGLQQGPGSGSRPPPVRQYDTDAAKRRPSEANGRRKSEPLTQEELSRLRGAAQSNPNDQQTQLRLAKGLVEAAKVLADEGGRADSKTRSDNRNRYTSEAHRIIKKLSDGGNPEATFFLADSLGTGTLGLSNDPKQAFSLYQTAAKQNHPQAAYRTAVCCEIGPEEGGGTRRDIHKAIQWYRFAGGLGDPAGLFKLGMIYLKGLLDQPRNLQEGLDWLEQAADKADNENPHACHELAQIYENPDKFGLGAFLARDDRRAVELFTKSGKLGYKYSQFRVAQAYEYGHLGCPIDARHSIVWYTRAAAQGEHQSELALSGWYLTGAEGILDHSDTEAFLWARKAASSEPPLPKALFALGYYTEVGIGCTRSLEDAKKWYGKAAARNFPKAQDRLDELRRGGASAQRQQRDKLSRSNPPKNDADCVVM